MATSPDLIDLLSASAGLIFETMLIAALYVATAVGVLIAGRRNRLFGALVGMVSFAMLAALLVFGGPLTTLRGYAACINRENPACSIG